MDFVVGQWVVCMTTDGISLKDGKIVAIEQRARERKSNAI